MSDGYNNITMGPCMSAQKRRRGSSSEVKALGVVPEGTQTLNREELPNLRFTFILEDIKVRKCEYKDLSLMFKIDEVGEYSTNFKKMDQNKKASWRITHRMECQLNEYDLRTKFLVVEAINRSKETLCSIKVNLYQIWRGPYHLNLPMDMPQSPEARVSFNFKMSQNVHIHIDNIQTIMTPNHRKNDGQYYSFWIEPIINQQVEPAKHCYFLKINDGKMGIRRTRSKRFEQPEPAAQEEEVNRIISQKDILQVYDAPSSQLVWTKDKAKELHMPEIDTILESYQLRQTSLYLLFFSVEPGKQHKFQVDSSCFISVPRIIDGDHNIEKDPKTKIIYHLYDTTVTQKLFNHGKEMGQAKIKLKVKIQSHERQMTTCVRTEKGIQTETPVYVDTKHREGEQIKNLKKLHTTAQKEIINLQKANPSNKDQIVEIMVDIKDALKKIIKTVSITSKESIMMYEYHNENEVIEGQALLIDIGFKVLAYIKQRIHQEVQDLCWQLLSLILKRGELSLAHLGFSRAEKEKINNSNVDEFLRGKIRIGIDYLELLNAFLETTLKSLANKGQQSQQNFAESFCSYAYFRIPIFRQCVLAIIRKPEDPQVEEWKAFITSMGEGLSKDRQEHESFYGVKFNWEANFYKALGGESDFKASQTKLQQVMEAQKGWKERLAKRRGAFFTFLQNLVKDIEYVCVVTKYLEWDYLPGYSRLLFAFLAELKQMPVIQMSERFKRCLLKMLANEKLLNVIVVMLVRKANVYDVRSTYIVLSILDDIFRRLRKMERSIPTTFDYKFLLSGIKIVLESEYEFNISKLLIILYNHFNFFSPEFSLEFILFLMSRYFYRFFFHWSFNLRRVFHTLIFVKVHVLREKEEGGSMIWRKKNKDKNKDKSKPASSPYYSQLKIFIIQRYEYLMGVIRQQLMPSLTQPELVTNFGNQNLHKVMKHKLAQRKKGKGQEDQTKKKVRDPTLAPARFFSAGISKKMIVTKNKIYFKPQEMQVNKFDYMLIGYVKRAVGEYKGLMESLDKKYLENPDYEPELVSKKMKDQDVKEKELEENEVEEW